MRYLIRREQEEGQAVYSDVRWVSGNAQCYEIIYVVIGEDGRSSRPPWRLGHLFAFDEGEDLLHNSRFSICCVGFSSRSHRCAVENPPCI